MHFLVALYIYFLHPILTFLFFLIIAWVVVSWLISFNVINMRNPNARALVGVLNAVVDPMCRPVRRIIPPLNGVLDLSPMLVMLIIVFVRDWALPQLISAIIGPRIPI